MALELLVVLLVLLVPLALLLLTVSPTARIALLLPF